MDAAVLRIKLAKLRWVVQDQCRHFTQALQAGLQWGQVIFISDELPEAALSEASVYTVWVHGALGFALGERGRHKINMGPTAGSTVASRVVQGLQGPIK